MFLLIRIQVEKIWGTTVCELFKNEFFEKGDCFFEAIVFFEKNDCFFERTVGRKILSRRECEFFIFVRVKNFHFSKNSPPNFVSKKAADGKAAGLKKQTGKGKFQSGISVGYAVSFLQKQGL